MENSRKKVMLALAVVLIMILFGVALYLLYKPEAQATPRATGDELLVIEQAQKAKAIEAGNR